MAIRYAVASGNWSDASTWDGSTLPATGDIIYLNNKSVEIDSDILLGETDPTVNAGSFIVGHRYRITLVGTTIFTGIGSTANTEGYEFTATGVGSGTGTAIQLTTLTNASLSSPAITADGALHNRTVNSIVRLCLLGGSSSYSAVLIQYNNSLALTGSIKGGTTSNAVGMRVDGSGDIDIIANEISSGTYYSAYAIDYTQYATSNLNVIVAYCRAGAAGSSATLIRQGYTTNHSNVTISSPNGITDVALLDKRGYFGTTTITVPTIVSTTSYLNPIMISNGGDIVINANILGSGVRSYSLYITLQNEQNLTVNGYILGSSTSTSSASLSLSLAENNTISINGDVTSGYGNTSYYCGSLLVYGSLATNRSRIIIDGSVNGNVASGAGGTAIFISSGNPIISISGNLTGSLFGSSSSGTFVSSSSAPISLTVAGNVIGGTVGYLIDCTGNDSYIDIYGNLGISGSSGIKIINFGSKDGTNNFRVRGTVTIDIPAGGTAFGFKGAGTTFTFDLGMPPIGNTYVLFEFSDYISYTYTGDLIGSDISNSWNYYTPIVVTGTSPMITINGNIINRRTPGITSQSTSSIIVINGNISSDHVSASSIANPGFLTVNGNITATDSVLIDNTKSLEINGICSCSDTSTAVTSSSFPILFSSGILQFSPGGKNPLGASNVIFPNLATNNVTIQVSTDGVSANESIRNNLQWEAASASPDDVRLGTTYGAGDIYTGTCAVPLPGSVLFGVPVDGTVGTVTVANEPAPTPGEVATAVRSELATELAHIDAAITSRSTLDAAGVRSELATELARIDIPISDATTDISGIPSAIANAEAVRSELATELARIDIPISDATTDISGIPADVRTELGAELERIRNCATVDSTGAQLTALL